MKTDNISKVINNLLIGNYNAILINGDWGVGKTYKVKEFIKNNKSNKKKKRIKIAYTSLFGKNSIDEINTELYKIFHPKAKILNVISSVVKLVNVGINITSGINISNIGTINVDAKLDNNKEQVLKKDKKLKQKKNKESLIVIDDFERKCDKISSDELLGYINGLINQGFKIVVLADLNKESDRLSLSYQIDDKEKKPSFFISKVNLGDDIIGVYKEKIFDRVYNITETPLDVINNVFGEDKYLLNEQLIIELCNNVRMAIKVNALYKQINKHIEEKKYKNVEKDAIMKICFYAVNELMTKKYLKKFEESQRDNKNLNFIEKTFDNIVMNYDSSLSRKEDLINAINAIYLDDDYYLLDCIYNKKDETNINESCFYFSDKNKIKVIKEQLNFILNLQKDREYNSMQINYFIRDWYYCSYLDLSFIDKDKLFKKLYEIQFKFFDFEEENENYLKIVNEYKLYEKEQKKYDIEKNLKNDDVVLFNLGVYHIYHYFNTFDNDTKEYIKNLFIENNFYIEKINGDIERTNWTKNNEICQLIKDVIPELKEKLFKILNDILKSNTSDLSCQDRIKSLIKNYNLDNKQIIKK